MLPFFFCGGRGGQPSRAAPRSRAACSPERLVLDVALERAGAMGLHFAGGQRAVRQLVRGPPQLLGTLPEAVVCGDFCASFSKADL